MAPKRRFANLKVAFEEDAKAEKDQRIGKIVKKMEEREKQSQRQKKRFTKKAKQAEIAIDNKPGAGSDTEESAVNETSKPQKSGSK